MFWFLDMLLECDSLNYMYESKSVDVVTSI